MSSRTSATRHRLQLAATLFLTVAAVYGFSRAIKSRRAAPRYASATYLQTVPPPAPAPTPVVVPPPVTTPSVSPAFMKAVEEGDVARMEELYTPGMMVEGTLGAAAARGENGAIEWLLEHGADVHESETEPEAPLLAADAHPATVKLLLERGANEPELAVAAIAGAPNAVARLIAKGARVNPGDGSTPLYDAVTSTLATPENKRRIVERLLAAGADPTVGEAPPIVAAARTCEPSNDEQGPRAPTCIAIIQLIGARGALVSSDALQAALALDDSVRGRVLDVLLAQRLEPDATAVALSQASGETPSAIKKLAARGVAWAWHDGEVDAVAPLLDAIDRLDGPAVRAMLEVGAPADLHYKDGRSPIGLALEKVSFDAAEAARIIEALLAHGANVNRRLPDGRTPLFAAAELGDIRIIHALLDRGARVNEVVLDVTALDAAEQGAHIAAARVLHARGGRRANAGQ